MKKRENYTNAEMAEVLEVLYANDVAIEHVWNLAADLVREYEAFLQEKAEAAWDDYHRIDGGADESYRRQMTEAGRGHLLK